MNYAKQLSRSVDYAEVQALYAAAGLSLAADLEALNSATRIAADPAAVIYLSENIIYNGQLGMPVLTLHTTGDGLVPVEDEQAYAAVVRRAHNNPLLRETFVHRAGHCEFTPAETVTAFQKLSVRLMTGKWADLEASGLNSAALSLGPAFNVLFVDSTVVPELPAFLEFEPLPFLRPFNDLTQ